MTDVSRPTREPVIASDPLVTERARAVSRAALLDGLANDPEVQTALRDLIVEVLKSEGFLSSSGSVAEQMLNIQEIVEERLIHRIRADAFRHPNAVVSTRRL
jgi:hypothetical protein